MLPLPILNVRLTACPEDWQQMTPTAQGRHCQSCNRTVVDFTAATQADLDAARAASPDGRLCGRFRQAQLASVQPLMRPKLRRFLVALVLVCGLGLTSGEAWAQLSQGHYHNPNYAAVELQLQLQTTEELSPVTLAQNQAPLLAPVGALPEARIVMGVYVEQMPTFPGGYDAFIEYVKRNAHYPKETTAAGKVFVSFLVTKAGAITDAKVMKGVHPLLDAEALRVVRQMPAWKPGQQNGQATEVQYTMPITFSREPEAAPAKRKGQRRAAGR